MMEKFPTIKRLTLVFLTVMELWEFKRLSGVTNFEISSMQKKITGDFSEADIELAVHGFRAQVMETI